MSYESGLNDLLVEDILDLYRFMDILGSEIHENRYVKNGVIYSYFKLL